MLSELMFIQMQATITDKYSLLSFVLLMLVTSLYVTPGIYLYRSLLGPSVPNTLALRQYLRLHIPIS
jgi:hypothetical protein